MDGGDEGRKNTDYLMAALVISPEGAAALARISARWCDEHWQTRRWENKLPQPLRFPLIASALAARACRVYLSRRCPHCARSGELLIFILRDFLVLGILSLIRSSIILSVLLPPVRALFLVAWFELYRKHCRSRDTRGRSSVRSIFLVSDVPASTKFRSSFMDLLLSLCKTWARWVCKLK